MRDREEEHDESGCGLSELFQSFFSCSETLQLPSSSLGSKLDDEGAKTAQFVKRSCDSSCISPSGATSTKVQSNAVATNQEQEFVPTIEAIGPLRRVYPTVIKPADPHEQRQVTARASSSSNWFGATTKAVTGNKMMKNCWSQPPASFVKVRGRSYLKDRKKIPSSSSLFTSIGMDFIKRDDLPKKKKQQKEGIQGESTATWSFREDLFHSDSNDNGGGQKDAKDNNVRPFLLTVKFILPAGSLHLYFIPALQTLPPLWLTFLNSSDEYRSQRFKFLPEISVGPSIVKQLVGNRPLLIAKKVPTEFAGSLAENYLDITMNVAQGSAFASSLTSRIVGKSAAVDVDFAFIIESLEEAELPEVVLAMVRMHKFDTSFAPTASEWKEKQRSIIMRKNDDEEDD
jgi:hypothetical protein